MRTGAELFIDSAAQLGIHEIFTLVGDHLNEVLLYAGRRGFRVIDMRHEAAVVHAADSWARCLRRPSLALVTGGPGHTNALTGMATANLAGSPVIAVSGARPLAQASRGAFQDVDQVGSARPLVKWAAEVTRPDSIPFHLARAYSEAVAGRPGTVHLTIPVDVFTGKTGAEPCGVPTVAQAASVPDLERAVELLRSAERPVVIVGGGVWWSRAEQALADFAKRTHLPVFTMSLGRGALPDTDPQCFGYADPSLNRGAAKALAETDLALVIGKRIDFRLGLGKHFAAGTQVIQVDVHAPELGLNRELAAAVQCDAGAFLRAFPALPPRQEWLNRLRTLRAQWDHWLEEQARHRGGAIHPAAFYSELRAVMPEDTLISWDGGDFVHWGRAMLSARHPGGWVRLGPLGTIGASLPNALALKAANPNRPVLMVTGDGSIGFYLAELDSLVRHNLPVVIVVGNDAGWGLERELQGGESTVGCELRPSRYDVIMQGFGGEGENITRLDEVRPALERAFAAGRPYLLNVNIRGVRSPFTRWKIGD